jgi:hypothetical protein
MKFDLKLNFIHAIFKAQRPFQFIQPYRRLSLCVRYIQAGKAKTLSACPGTRRCFGIVMIILVFVCFFSNRGSATTIINIEPMIMVEGRLEDNFYMTENNAREVYTYILRPGLQLGVTTAKSATYLNFIMDMYFYNDKSDVPQGEHPAEDENYVGYFWVFDTDYALTDRMSVGLRDSFYRTRRVDRYDEFTDNTERRLHNINRLVPMVTYQLKDRFDLGLRYRRQDINYDDTDIDDSVEHRGIIDLLYNPSRTKTFDLQYQYWIFDQTQEDFDYTSNQLLLIFQKQYKYTAFELGGGYQHRDFKDPHSPDAYTPAYRFAISWRNPPSFEIGRRIFESDSLDIRSHIFFDYEKNFNNLGGFRTDNRFTLSMGHLFLEKLKLTFYGYYLFSDYDFFTGLSANGDLAIREDEVYGISGGIRYLVNDRWSLLFVLGKTDRSSNLVGYSYENTYCTINFELNFPLGRVRIMRAQ